MRTALNIDTLDKAGLNLCAVFDLTSLPENILTSLDTLYDDLTSYQQLILIAHGGRRMWQKVRASIANSAHPIDDYARSIVTRFCQQHQDIGAFSVIYPSQSPIGLQSLGELVGWHHTSPFRIGINQDWGSWFAYRAVILTASQFQTTLAQGTASPCDTCSNKPCISACPAKALENEFSLERCLDYRKQAGSLCKDRCLARMSCPAAKKHQYSLEQINYHYSVSMKMIETLGL